jgi:hypothetical protein
MEVCSDVDDAQRALGRWTDFFAMKDPHDSIKPAFVRRHLIMQDFPLGDRLISEVGYHRGGVTGGAEGDDCYASFFLLASFRDLTPR